MKKAMMATWSESEESSEEEKEKEVANMCFMAIDDLDEDKWFLDSGCSRHMTGMNPSLPSLQREKEDMSPLETMQKEESLVKDWRPPWENCKLRTKDNKKKVEGSKKEDSPLALPPPQQVQGESSQDLPKDWKFVINHPQDQIIGNPSSGHDGELNYFLGLQIKQLKEGTFINQAKYIKDLLKRFNMKEAKVMKTPMSSSIKLDMDEKGKSIDSTMYRGMIGSLLYLTASRPDIMYSGDNFELIGFSDADFAGCRVERKSTSGTCHFLEHSLVSWHSKKQNSVALSTAEAEYIAAGLCCAQILWMKQTLSDFNLSLEHVPIKCDNTSAIIFQKNPVQHSRTKHIEIRHHFLRDHAQKGDITLELDQFGLFLGPIEVLKCSLTRFEARVSSLDGFGLRILTGSSLFARHLLYISPFLDFGWLLERRRVLPELRANALLSPLSSSSRPRLAERRGTTPPSSAQLRIIRGTRRISPRERCSRRNINFFQLQSRGMTYGLGGPIRTTVRGVEIELSPKSICRILDVPPVGLRVYEAKAWPTIPGFEPREAIQRLCGLADAHEMGKPSAHSLTVPSRVLHHMICSILLPRGGHRDEVSYYEAFLVDSLLTGRRIHVGYVMMRHMMSCCENTTRVLPYGRFLTRVFKDAGVDLSRETEFEAPSIYDTYDEHSLGRMKLEKAPDGSWVRKAERQARGHDQLHPGRGPELDIPAPHQSEGIHVEATFSEPMMTEPSFTELPSQAPHAPEHPPWMDLSAQISSLGTRMEELAVVHDTHFIPWRIASISIRSASPLSLSSLYRGFSVLRAARRVNTRR
ncbi:Retrovirus-related Pol polyprotein from transposon RE1 [Vitis vinifera]|uniref:Retrovirus-related Pol polyprotein from transposon RE1 n=1 Tax=Vitis vinifera TaxID=29760 RepID=A0A438IPZ1_VITVI|nr:Retrovirus-related Pol polyprotein from transposon RE1 [Vitis vinifera]